MSATLFNNRDPQLQFEIEQFYYHEANLLDERKYLQWLELLCSDMQYLMPGRYSPQRDLKKRGSEDFIAVADELQQQQVDALPLREESAMIMAFRAQRAFKANAFGSNPPARTRRIVSNVQIQIDKNSYKYSVKSNFLLYYSRHRDDNHIYSGQRIDTLVGPQDGTKDNKEMAFKIAKREVILDWNLITGPTVGLFF